MVAILLEVLARAVPQLYLIQLPIIKTWNVDSKLIMMLDSNLGSTK
jgi:hypothetical protein